MSHCDVPSCHKTALYSADGKVYCEEDYVQLSQPNKKFVCKHCKVEVMGKTDFRPILGKQHKKSCPRARTLN